MEQSRNRSKTDLHYYSDRLRRKLAELRFSPAAIVEAPSGYGKTTAIRDFLDDQLPQSAPVYWFTATDENPSAGFRRLCRKIDKIDSQAGERLLKIELPNAATIGEACDALRSIQCKYETYLVIDNFQFLQPFLPLSFFLALIEHGGEGLHIIIVTQMLKRNILAAITGHRFLHITVADLRLNPEDIRRYYTQAGVGITPEDARDITQYTGGWIIAVYLQFCAFQETGAFSSTRSILTLMENLVWDALTETQQTFLMRLSAFEVITVQQACVLSGFETLPEYALEALESPFIRHEPAQRRYELHSLLTELLLEKRRERDAGFEQECLRRAGDFCRDAGKASEALGFYMQIKDYERMLALDLSPLILHAIGTTPFAEIALDIAQNCPAGIKDKYPLSLLRIAWALLLAQRNEPFDVLMEELRANLKANGQMDVSSLWGEWTLLSSFEALPCLERATALLRKAAVYFNGKCSQVILPTAPWYFGDYCQLAQFHSTPGETDREADALEDYITLYAQLTNGHGSGADALFRAELAFHRGDLSGAKIFAYKAAFLAENRQQSIVQLGAAMLLAEIALQKADFAGWQHAVSSMERAASYPLQNTFVVRAALDNVRGVLLTELGDQAGIADWLKRGEFSGRVLLAPMVNNALFVHLNFLILQGEFDRLIGTAQAIIREAYAKTPFSEILLLLLTAIGYTATGNRTQAALLVEQAAEKALPDGLILPFAAYSWLLDGLADELVEKKYPRHLEQFRTVKTRYALGWETLHDALFAEEWPADLTPRESEVAKMAANGLRNSEIARILSVTESTVRTHLRTIFQKLDIDRRAKLAEKLK
ncbi:MAG: LuxR C-terminal-related transcriptional regulator [Clostridia bacterium]|jgi:LuxR family maltose regulon positive regulatory protein|nr:LuxR C-terminal-related transcriptional regulator [Clostridia bacterium]